MQFAKFLVVGVVLIVRTSQTDDKVIITSRRDVLTSRLVKDLVKIVTSCFGGRIDAVGLAGDLPDSVIRTLSVHHIIPATLLDDTDHITHGTTTNFPSNKFRHELQVFIIGASSWSELSIIIQGIIKPSIWWNHVASFFILDWTPTCHNYGYFLLGAWHLGLLNVKVICYRPNYGSYIFNYNPFTNHAPASWRQFHVSKGRNNHPFTYFMWDYRANNAICAALDFVKTKDLGGYEMIVEGNIQGFKFRNNTMTGLRQLSAGRERLLDILYGTLNATPKFTGRTRSYMPTDVDMGIRYAVLSNKGISTTYPYQKAGLVIITKFRGHKSQLDKIFSVTDVESRIGMGIVYLITLIFLKYCVNHALVPALLNLVRITCNTGFSNLPDTTAPRLFLTGLLFYVVTMQGIYQGNLASLLTNKIPLRNVNSLDDLVNLDYKRVYGSGQLGSYIEHPDLKERLVTTKDTSECITHVLDDSSAACIVYAQGIVFDMARQNDLHLSSEYVAQNYVGFLIKRFWYAEQQINRIIGSIMEADIFEPWEEKCNPTKLSDFQFDKEVLKNSDYKVIEFGDVRFAFVILGIGLACATVVFIVEISLRHICRLLRCLRVTLISYCDRLTATLVGISRRCNPRRAMIKAVRIKVMEKEQVNTVGS